MELSITPRDDLMRRPPRKSGSTLYSMRPLGIVDSGRSRYLLTSGSVQLVSGIHGHFFFRRRRCLTQLLAGRIDEGVFERRTIDLFKQALDCLHRGTGHDAGQIG